MRASCVLNWVSSMRHSFDRPGFLTLAVLFYLDYITRGLGALISDDKIVMRALKIQPAGMPCVAATRPNRILSPAHASSALGVARMSRVCMASKGFGDETTSTTEASVKVNDRGKVSSRRGPVSTKQMKEQALQQVPMQAPEARVGDPSSPAGDSSPSRPISTSASSPPRSREPEKVVASTPQAVVDRMFPRMVTCALIPVVFGLMLLVFFYFQKESLGDDFPMWIVYVSQNLTFGGGLLGITYGIFSTSWDPNREGSVLGWDEFRVNFSVVLNKGK